MRLSSRRTGKKLAQQGFTEHSSNRRCKILTERCSRTGMLYPGTIFGIAAHGSGETAKAVARCAVDATKSFRGNGASHGF